MKNDKGMIPEDHKLEDILYEELYCFDDDPALKGARIAEIRKNIWEDYKKNSIRNRTYEQIVDDYAREHGISQQTILAGKNPNPWKNPTGEISTLASYFSNWLGYSDSDIIAYFQYFHEEDNAGKLSNSKKREF